MIKWLLAGALYVLWVSTALGATVTVCASGCDFTEPDAAQDSLKNTGGTIDILPGTYVIPDGAIYMAKRTVDITFRGAAGSGDRPIIQGQFIWSSLVGSTLTLTDIIIDGSGPVNGGRGQGLRGLKGSQRFVLNNVDVHDFTLNCITQGRKGNELYWPDSYFEMNGGEVYNCGQGNAKHNLYLQFATVKVNDIYSHSCNGCEALKIVGWYVQVTNSELDNRTISGRLVNGTGRPVKIGTTPVNIASGGDVVFTGNTIRFEKVQGQTGSQMLLLSSRRQIFAANRPPYDYTPTDPRFWQTPATVGLDFHDPLYWITAAGLPGEVFETELNGNTFELYGPDDNVQAVVTKGTYPNTPPRSFSPFSCPLPVPEEWFERHHITVGTNMFVGFPANEQRYFAYLPNVGASCGAECQSLTQAELDGLECTIPGTIRAEQFQINEAMVYTHLGGPPPPSGPVCP